MSYIAVGPKIDGKQSIVLAKEGKVPVTYVSTPEKIDAFMKEAKLTEKKQNKKTLLTVSLSTIIPAAIGALCKGSMGRCENAVLAGGLGLITSLFYSMFRQATMHDKSIEKFIQNNPQ